VTSTSAAISWREPSPDQHNGILLGYSVTVMNAKDNMKLQVNATKIFISDVVLSPLEPPIITGVWLTRLGRSLIIL